ncbi:hypothetical protein PM082_024748 [Marasmius tenuissimus]|nr:hypothetical protein PM082_024748 [Marasmius tenuissimus]
MKNTDLDGRRYAEERGYPELVQSGPPEQRMFDLFDSKESNTDKDPSRSPCSQTPNTQARVAQKRKGYSIGNTCRTNPRIARYIQIITTRRKSSRRFVRTGRRSKGSSSASTHGVQANRARKRRHV